MPTVDGRKTGGRQKGTPNKATKKARQAVSDIVEGNAHRIQGWIDHIERDEGPLEAYKAFMQLMEYHVPKLSRAEVTGENGAPLQVTVTSDDEQL